MQINNGIAYRCLTGHGNFRQLQLKELEFQLKALMRVGGRGGRVIRYYYRRFASSFK